MQPSPSHRIRSVSILGGFLDGLRFDLAERLNCFIGARGAGKTTVLELVRYALGQMPDAETELWERKRVERLVERNLEGGRVQLEIETKEGLRYLVRRDAGEEPVVLTADGKPTEINLQAGGVIQADIYSQNEIEGIADRTLSQLVLLDNFAKDRLADIEAEIRRVKAQLAANAGQAIPLQDQDAVLAEELVSLPNIEEKLRGLAGADGDGNGALDHGHAHKSLRHRERLSVDGMQAFLQGQEAEFAGLQGKLSERVEKLFSQDLLSGPNGPALATIKQHLLAGTSKADDLVRQARQPLAEALRYLETAGAALAKSHAEQEIAFRQMIEEHGKLRGQALERSRLEKQRNELLAKQQVRIELAAKLLRLQDERAASLRRLSELRDERFVVRQEVAQMLSEQLAPAIRVQIIQDGNTASYQRFLEEALKGARIRHGKLAERLAQGSAPYLLAEVVRKKDINQIVDAAQVNAEQAERIFFALSEPRLLCELETIDLFDLPQIDLKDGDGYKNVAVLSTGQKCTAILPILLLDTDNPLLVDQPEDNLDNRFIFETVVESIRKVKPRRQLIFVTHNPNIPVLGDADRVFVLESDGTQARKASEGTVDDCKDHIVTLLEGGAKAFKERKRRYAY